MSPKDGTMICLLYNNFKNLQPDDVLDKLIYDREENIIKDNRRKWVPSGLPFHGDYDIKISHPVKKKKLHIGYN